MYTSIYIYYICYTHIHTHAHTHAHTHVHTPTHRTPLQVRQLEKGGCVVLVDTAVLRAPPCVCCN